MDVAAGTIYSNVSKIQEKEVRGLVMDGLEQVKNGNVKLFADVCDRLEKKYGDGEVSN